jgi:hypothetical protein
MDKTAAPKAELMAQAEAAMEHLLVGRRLERIQNRGPLRSGLKVRHFS